MTNRQSRDLRLCCFLPAGSLGAVLSESTPGVKRGGQIIHFFSEWTLTQVVYETGSPASSREEASRDPSESSVSFSSVQFSRSVVSDSL